jgi:hypothetical protein
MAVCFHCARRRNVRDVSAFGDVSLSHILTKLVFVTFAAELNFPWWHRFCTLVVLLRCRFEDVARLPITQSSHSAPSLLGETALYSGRSSYAIASWHDENFHSSERALEPRGGPAAIPHGLAE